MTRVVVYDREDHEPITVVEIPIHYMREVEAGRRNDILLLYREQYPSANVRQSAEPPQFEPLDQICTRLIFERVGHYDGKGPPKTLFWYLYPSRGEDALRVKSAFLPGQLPEVQRLEREARFRGLLAGLTL